MADFKKEAAIILSCDKGVDYSSRTQVQQIYTALLKNNSLTSDVGRKYTDKLKSMLTGNNTPACFLCGMNSDAVICANCKATLEKACRAETPEGTRVPENRAPITDAPEKPSIIMPANPMPAPMVEPAPSLAPMPTPVPSPAPTPVPVQPTVAEPVYTQNTIYPAGSDIQTVPPDSQQIINNSGTAKKTEGFFKRIKSFWNSRTKPQRIIIAAVGAVLSVSIVTVATRAIKGEPLSSSRAASTSSSSLPTPTNTVNPASSSRETTAAVNNSSGSSNAVISSREDAEALIKSLFSENEYRFSGVSKKEYFKAIFSAPKGQRYFLSDYLFDVRDNSTTVAYFVTVSGKTVDTYDELYSFAINEDGHVILLEYIIDELAFTRLS